MKRNELLDILRHSGFEQKPWKKIAPGIIWLHRPRRGFFGRIAKTVAVVEQEQPDKPWLTGVADNAFTYVDQEIMRNKREKFEAPEMASFQKMTQLGIRFDYEQAIRIFTRRLRRHWCAIVVYCDTVPDSAPKALMHAAIEFNKRCCFTALIERGTDRLILPSTRKQNARRAMEDFCRMLGLDPVDLIPPPPERKKRK